MGLAAFNRMRRVEAMRPENIKKEKEEVKVVEPKVEEVEEYVEVETNDDGPVTESATRRRRIRD